MTEQQHFSDEVLTAYLDREVDAPTQRAVENALRSDAVLSERLASLQMPTKKLKGAFDSLLAAAPPMPDLPSASRPVAPRTALALAASLILGIGLGAGVMLLRPERSSGWMEYVAAYQALYVNATLASVEPGRQTTAAELAKLSTALGYDLSAAMQGGDLDFKRGQQLGYQGNTLIQLAYLSPAGAPVALCIIRKKGAVATGVSAATLESMAAAHWQKDGFEFLLIGGTDQALITDAAQSMAQRL